MLHKFLDPKNDVAFRKIFGSEKNKAILIHFLNDMIHFQGGPVTEITFLKPIQDPEISAKKSSIVDILCKDEKGQQFIVEMQVAQEKGFAQRAQYYASKAYVSQMNVKGKYEELKAVIFLAITKFVMFPHREAVQSDHIILEREFHHHDLRGFSFTFFELPKFKKKIDQLTTVVDKWCYFFKYAPNTNPEQLSRIIGDDLIIQQAYEQLDRFSWSEEELLSYEQSEKQEADLIAAFDQKFDEGKAAGKIEGKAEGKIEGKIEGKAEGKLEIAAALNEKGFALAEISALTGLPLELLEKELSVTTPDGQL